MKTGYLSRKIWYAHRHPEQFVSDQSRFWFYALEMPSSSTLILLPPMRTPAQPLMYECEFALRSFRQNERIDV